MHNSCSYAKELITFLPGEKTDWGKFEEKREQLLFGFSDPKSEWFIKEEAERAQAAEERDEYVAANVFWLPPEACRIPHARRAAGRAAAQAGVGGVAGGFRQKCWIGPIGQICSRHEWPAVQTESGADFAARRL